MKAPQHYITGSSYLRRLSVFSPSHHDSVESEKANKERAQLENRPWYQVSFLEPNSEAKWLPNEPKSSRHPPPQPFPPEL